MTVYHKRYGEASEDKPKRKEEKEIQKGKNKIKSILIKESEIDKEKSCDTKIK